MNRHTTRPRGVRRTAAILVGALAAGTLVVWGPTPAVQAEPLPVDGVFGGVVLTDASGDIVANAAVSVRSAEDSAWLDLHTDHLGVARVSESASATLFADAVSANLRVNVLDLGTLTFGSFEYRDGALRPTMNLADPLLFSRDSVELIEVQLPLDLPDGGLTGTVSTTPALSGSALTQAVIRVVVEQIGAPEVRAEARVQGDGSYRMSGLPDGAYTVTFLSTATSETFPLGFAQTWFDGAPTRELATPLVIVDGIVVSVDASISAAGAVEGRLLRQAADGPVPVLDDPRDLVYPAVSLYPASSTPTGLDAVQVVTSADPGSATGDFRFEGIAPGDYKVAFGTLESGRGTAGFVPYLYAGGTGTAATAETVQVVANEVTRADGIYPSFVDVSTQSLFIDEITWLAATGISTGYGDGTFRPLAPVARDAMAAFLYRFAGSPAFTPPVISPFPDVSTSNQFYREITWLASTGITTGYPDRTFRPLEPVNRDAMAAFLYRYAREFEGIAVFAPPTTSPFTDVAVSTQFFREMAWLASSGVSTGFDDGTYRPLWAVNRDAMAAFLFRFANSAIL